MAPRVPILMYHKVAPVNPKSKFTGHYVAPAVFDRQMRALRLMGFRSVPLADLFAHQDVPRPIVVTFDDGYRNFLTNAFPILKKHQTTATVFLVSQHLGGSNRWDVMKGDVEEGLMTVEEIAECRSGGIDFGGHTANHVNLAETDPETAWREIAECRCELEEKLEAPVPTFAYPYGAKNPRVLDMVAKAGYRYACSTEKGVNDPGTDPFALKRINVRRDSVLPVFVMKIWRAMRFDR